MKKNRAVPNLCRERDFFLRSDQRVGRDVGCPDIFISRSGPCLAHPDSNHGRCSIATAPENRKNFLLTFPFIEPVLVPTGRSWPIASAPGRSSKTNLNAYNDANACDAVHVMHVSCSNHKFFIMKTFRYRLVIVYMSISLNITCRPKATLT